MTAQTKRCAVPFPARSLYVDLPAMRVRIALWDFADKYEGSIPAKCAYAVGDSLDVVCRTATTIIGGKK